MADETNINLNNLNRFLTLLKTYIAEQISSGGITIDSEMSDTSENAVQNKVIKAYVDTNIQAEIGDMETVLSSVVEVTE